MSLVILIESQLIISKYVTPEPSGYNAQRRPLCNYNGVSHDGRKDNGIANALLRPKCSRKMQQISRKNNLEKDSINASENKRAMRNATQKKNKIKRNHSCVMNHQSARMQHSNVETFFVLSSKSERPCLGQPLAVCPSRIIFNVLFNFLVVSAFCSR